MRRSCCPALPRMTRVPDVELVSVSRRGKGVVNLSEIVVSNPPDSANVVLSLATQARDGSLTRPELDAVPSSLEVRRRI